MSLILVATVGGVLLVRLRRCPPDGRVGVRRGGARDTAGNGERAAHRRVRPSIVPERGPRPPPALASSAASLWTGPTGLLPDDRSDSGGRLADRHLLALPRGPV